MFSRRAACLRLAPTEARPRSDKFKLIADSEIAGGVTAWTPARLLPERLGRATAYNTNIKAACAERLRFFLL